MPYVLSPLIGQGSPGMWQEGPAYEKKTIYSIQEGKMPPVNYDEHTIRSHSLTHLETPAHTLKEGKTLDVFYKESLNYFYGKTLVIKLSGNNYKPLGNGIFHWIITVEEIKERLNKLGVVNFPDKLLISTNIYPENSQGYHDPNYILTLSQGAADFLVSHKNFNLYGTSWKSSDYNPGKVERPIHNTLFMQSLILENLCLNLAPEGMYFMAAFPLPFWGASESPVVPVLFEQKELIE